ncbi:MAG: 50S ribosomal protein L18 [Candidatus Aminicenantes bacterium]|nr:50S ribosomal protein L18 [Candidatus Aminicenantes bacterium]
MHKDKSKTRKRIKTRIRRRIRAKIRGTAERPRVFVFKSNRYIYAQAFNDDTGTVLVSACTLEKAFKEKAKNAKNAAGCRDLGQVLAERLKEKKIDRIVFDRGTYPYHGRVKALAEALRKGGLGF